MALTKQIISKSINATATTYVGKDGEVWADPVNNTLRIGDGTTAGGILLTGGGGGGGTTTWATLGDKNNANGPLTVALGMTAGLTGQGAGGVSIGTQAGMTTQGLRAIAIGLQAAEITQAQDAIAIGPLAGYNNQGQSAIAIGANAGNVNQAARSIVISASGVAVNNTQEDSLVITPIRNAGGTHALEYNPTTGEVTYDTLGGSGSGLQSRDLRTSQTSSLADGAEADLDITGFKAYALLFITTDRAARVRLYVNAATRTADASRAEGVDPTSDAGLIAEVITTGADTVIISPGAYGFNLENFTTTNIPCRVTNKSGSTSTVQVTLGVLQLEA